MLDLESIALIQAQGLAGLRPDQQIPRSVGGWVVLIICVPWIRVSPGQGRSPARDRACFLLEENMEVLPWGCLGA